MVSPSLSSKLRVLRRTLRSKFKPTMVFDLDHLKLIARHMPKTSAELSTHIPSHMVTAYGDKILEVTIAHGRDQSRFEECVLEIRAFARGGLPGMDRLDKIYTQVLKHFEMEDETEEIFDACNLFYDINRNRLSRKRTASEMADGFSPPSSAACSQG